MADASDEVAGHELTMRRRALLANFECSQMRIEFALQECVAKITPLVHECAVWEHQWEIEQRDAWAIAQRDPQTWLDRLVQG